MDERTGAAYIDIEHLELAINYLRNKGFEAGFTGKVLVYVAGKIEHSEVYPVDWKKIKWED